VAAVWALRAAYVVLALDNVSRAVELARVNAPAAPTPSRP
jgi:hypothetical protein